MTLQSLSDEELIRQAKESRKNLEAYESALDENDNSVDRAAMRNEMSRLNLLKIEAKRRGLSMD